MNIFDKLKELFGYHADKLPADMPSLDELKNKLPEDLNSVDEVKAKLQDTIEQHSDTIQQVTDKIPGETDDKIVESLTNKQ